MPRLPLLSLIAVTALSGCRERAPSPSPAENALPITVRAGNMSAPDSAASGWTRVHVDDGAEKHIVVLFRLPAESTPDDVAAFVAALDTAPATPAPAVAIGGPEVGARSDVIVRLAGGVYVLACVRRGDDGHRHASAGESAVVHVRGTAVADTTPAPKHTQTVRLMDFAYAGDEQWAAGQQLLRIENTGAQDHQLRLARLRDGATMAQWMEAENPDSVATTVAGMARIGAGEIAYLPVDLTIGRYVVYCLIADPARKLPHIELGMLRAIDVR